MSAIRVPGRLDRRIALATGSTSRIGRGIAITFAEEGARVTVRGCRDRPGRPRDIAYCAVYLASDEAEHVTGAIFNIHGGASAIG